MTASTTGFLVQRTSSTGTQSTGFSNQTLVQKMRHSLTSVNAVTAQPLIQPSAWAASTTVYQGQAVSNGGNNYICMGAGATAASGGPTGTGSAPITDNVATWYYWGPTYTTASNAPTLSSVAFGSRYTGLYWTTATNNYGIGSSRINDASNFVIGGCAYTDGAGSNNSLTWNANSGLIGTISFMTDAPSFQFVGGAGNNSSVCLYVNQFDGKGLVPVTLGSSFPNNTTQFYQVVNADRRTRLYVFEMQVNLCFGFYGVLMNDAISKVWAPNSALNYSISFVGTSYLDGSGQHPVVASLGIGPQIARLLGVTNYWVDRYGSGTGYVAVGSNSAFGSATRLGALVASNPSLVVVTGGGINDFGAISNPTSAAALATEQAAALAYYQAVRSALPNVPIIVIGSEAGAYGPGASVFNMELAVANAVAQFGDSNTFYIPQSGSLNEKAWISGTGTTASTNSSGNSDVLIGADGIHPVQLGVNYLANQSANAIGGVIATL